MRRCLLPLLVLVTLVGSRADAANLGPYRNPANGHDYFVTEDQLTWAAAEAWAVALGGHLVAINDAAESAWLLATLPLDAEFHWIGARDDLNTTDDVFEWTTGEPWAFTNWTPGEPDDNAGLGGSGDYGVLARSTGQWLDTNGFAILLGAIAEVVPTAAVGPGAGGSPRLVVYSLPTRDRATVSLELPQAMPARLRVFDVSGRPVRTLSDGVLAAGRHECTWDVRDDAARRVGAGLYFVSLEAGGQRRTGRVVVIR